MDSLIPSDLGTIAPLVWTWTLQFAPRFVSAIAILVVGYIVARWAGRFARDVGLKSRAVDNTLAPVMAAVARYAILVLVFVAALGQLGVSTASLLAALGGLALAIGLALQGTLSNVAAGFMLLWLRPFQVGDFIEAGDISGTVKEIGLFATRIDSLEEIYRFVPNSELWNQPLINYTRNPQRMMNFDIGIAYDSDIDKARQIMLDLCTVDERVLNTPEPLVFVSSLGDNAVVLTWRAWIPTAQFWPTHRYLVETAKKRFDEAGIEIPFPQRVVHVIGGFLPGEPQGGQAAA
jgi:small conductance mechanosensitive channel